MKIDIAQLKSKLKITPRRTAVDYIMSIHRRTEVEGIKVLVQRVEEMREVVQRIEYYQCFNAYPLQQTCFFVELYCVAVTELSTAITSLMELNTFVSTYCNFRASPCSSLFDSMTLEYNALQLLFETVGLIQETHLGTWILPTHYGLLAESQLKRCELLRAWVADDPAQAGHPSYQPEQNLDAERAQQMEAYISVIRSRVSLERVSLAGTYLRHAEDRMFLSHSKFKQYAGLLAIQRGYTPKASDYLLNEDIRDPVFEGQ